MVKTFNYANFYKELVSNAMPYVVYCHLLLTAPVTPGSAVGTVNSPANATSVGTSYSDIARPAPPLTAHIESTEENTNSSASSAPNAQWFDIWQRSFTDTMDFTVKQLDGLFEGEEETRHKDRNKRAPRVVFNWLGSREAACFPTQICVFACELGCLR